jgi:cytochrome c
MKLLSIVMICLLTAIIVSDVTHQPEKTNVISKTEDKNLTRNDPDSENLRATPADARKLIDHAFEYLDKFGKSTAFEEFNNTAGDFCYKDAYIFAIDMEGNVLAHGGDQELVGTNQLYLKDSVGRYFIQEFIKLIKEKDEGWIEYKWRNYETFEIESKLTLLKRYDSKIFLGCGIYYGK